MVFLEGLVEDLIKIAIRKVAEIPKRKKEMKKIKEKVREVKVNVRKTVSHLKEVFKEEYSSLGIPSILYYQKNDQLQPLYKAKLDPSTREKWEIAQLSLFAYEGSWKPLLKTLINFIEKNYDEIYKFCNSQGLKVWDKPSYTSYLKGELLYLRLYLRNPSDILNSYNLYLKDAEKMEEKERLGRFLEEFGGPMFFMSPLNFPRYIAIREGIDLSDRPKFYSFLKEKFPPPEISFIKFLDDHYQSFLLPFCSLFASLVKSISSERRLKELFLYL